MKSLLLFFIVSLTALSINAQRCPVQDFQVGTGASEDIGSVRMPANGELALMTNNNAVGCGNSMSQESPSESLCLVGDNGQRKVTSAVPAGFVDLGLPSGKLWKDKNESGFFTYNQALSRFGKNLPSKEDLVELKLECKWSWTGSGYKVTGPNGNSIYLPASGCRNSNGNMDYVGSSGFYWSSSPGTSEIAWCLYFGSDRVQMYVNNLSCGQSVRLVQDK